MEKSSIDSRFLSHDLAVFAIHGGKLEIGTNQIAESIAGDDLSLYVYEGEGDLGHIPSNLYDEPKALELASKVETILSIHGQKDAENSFVMVGGLDKNVVILLEKRLRENGFPVKRPPDELDADNPNNICNKGKSGKGVQLEISRKLRRELWQDRNLLMKFSKAIRLAILK